MVNIDFHSVEEIKVKTHIQRDSRNVGIYNVLTLVVLNTSGERHEIIFFSNHGENRKELSFEFPKKQFEKAL